MQVKRMLRAMLAAAALAALAAAPASANVQVGASGWQWGNPLPQGNTVRVMSFAGATGYAAGDFGTLLKTTDGGTTWTGLPVGTFAGLGVVQALDANTVFAGGGCVARRSTDGGSTFTAVRFTPVEAGCRVGLRDLSFVSKDVGYLLMADGSILTTTDGGTQFSPRTAVPETSAVGGSAQPGAIRFLDASKGFATSGGSIFVTLDGGNAWTRVSSAGSTLHAVWFADAQHGFAVGDGRLFLRTDDGGTTWVPKDLNVPGVNYTSIRCAGTQLCLLTTSAGTQLVRTTDGGDTPGTAITPATDPIFAAAFASPTRVAAAGQQGATVVSDDAGVRFAPIGGHIAGAFSSLRIGGVPNTAYAPGADGRIAMTSDGGRTWRSDGNDPTSADLIDVAFPTATDGYALDVDGGLFHTTTGGRSWEPLGTGSTRHPSALLAPDADTVLVVGPRGIRRSTDAGQTFTQLKSNAVLRRQLDSIVRAHTGPAIFAWGPTTLVRSTDRGRTWVVIPRPMIPQPDRSKALSLVAFASAKAGFARDATRHVWRTTDAGRHWTLLASVGTVNVEDMSARSARVATLVLDGFGKSRGGYLLHTDDGGATWQPQFVIAAGIDGIVAGGETDLLAGGGSLLFSTTGGVAGDPSRLTLSTRRRQLPRAGQITVTGRLVPAGARAQVVVSMMRPGEEWLHQTVPVAANGTFTTAWRVPRGTTTFVAQWTGDFASAGAGSRPLTVTVGGAPRAHRRRHR
jgi:photosystem II stability/assembly factor-like uncharacterized protein